MATGRHEVLSTLVDVYIMEKESKDFYEIASHRANEDNARDTFRQLKSRKQTHMNYIQFLYGTIQSNGEIVSYDDFQCMKDIHLEEGWVPVREQEISYSYTDDTGILIHALEIEGRTHELYRTLAETARDSSIQDVYREMMMQEDANIDLLKKMPGAQIEE